MHAPHHGPRRRAALAPHRRVGNGHLDAPQAGTHRTRHGRRRDFHPAPARPRKRGRALSAPAPRDAPPGASRCPLCRADRVRSSDRRCARGACGRDPPAPSPSAAYARRRAHLHARGGHGGVPRPHRDEASPSRQNRTCGSIACNQSLRSPCKPVGLRGCRWRIPIRLPLRWLSRCRGARHGQLVPLAAPWSIRARALRQHRAGFAGDAEDGLRAVRRRWHRRLVIAAGDRIVIFRGTPSGCTEASSLPVAADMLRTADLDGDGWRLAFRQRAVGQ